ncbi:MAG: histidine ammonia-lyase [Bacteroidota bacterium]|jgi:histidine ammonia-lyase
MTTFEYGNGNMRIADALQLVSGEQRGILSSEIVQKVLESEKNALSLANGNKTVYGINTGFGILAQTKISAADTGLLQQKILQSHSAGVGKSIPRELAKLMLVTKAHSLARGFSGIRLETLQRILWFIDNDVIPVVPEKGSVGASGDLAPLSHLFLPLIGLGLLSIKDANGHVKIVDADSYLKEANVKPLLLGPKEGLALINGTQFILAHSIHGVMRFYQLLEYADLIGALSLEALKGSPAPFDERLHSLRPFPGSQLVAQRLRLLLQGSQIVKSHESCDRVQDPYSLRCIPQVHGASRNAWLHLKQLTEIELNAVTDNPILIANEESISGGNFHGQPLALPLDYACFAAAELGNISDRRSYLLLEGKWGLPTLLMENVGLNSGFMIPQYTTAALVTENKTLCFPASADSIPTSLGQEDHVSMGSISARKFNTILDNLEYILSIELLLAAQAIEFRRPLKSSDLVELVYQEVRKNVSFAKEDRVFSLDIEKVVQLIRSTSLIGNIHKNAAQLGVQLNKNFSEFDC